MLPSLRGKAKGREKLEEAPLSLSLSLTNTHTHTHEYTHCTHFCFFSSSNSHLLSAHLFPSSIPCSQSLGQEYRDLGCPSLVKQFQAGRLGITVFAMFTSQPLEGCVSHLIPEFRTRVTLAHRGHFAMSGDVFNCHTR